MACQITSQFNKKIGCFVNQSYYFYFKKQHSSLLNGEVIWQAIDSSLSLELHVLGNTKLILAIVV